MAENWRSFTAEDRRKALKAEAKPEQAKRFFLNTCLEITWSKM